MLEDNKLDEYYVCYFDVLGYKQYLEENPNDVTLLKKIKDIIHICRTDKIFAKEYTKIYDGKINSKKDFYIRAFSDNVILCFKTNYTENLHLRSLMFYLVMQIQYIALSKYGLLLRGGITKGKLYLDSDFVYGPALIKVVNMENNLAIFPRIIFDYNDFDTKDLEKGIVLESIMVDNDKINYINYFDGLQIFPNTKEKLKNNIIKKINQDSYYKINETNKEQIQVRESIITKILWVVTKYNEACEDKDKIKFTTRINPKLLKMELVLEEDKISNEK